MDHEIKSVIDDILVDTFEIAPDQIAADKNLFTDYGFDSLDAIDLIVKFQNHFQIKPPEQELRNIQTVADIYELVDRYVKRSA